MIAVCLVYIAARLWRLDASCLWFDEIFSVHAAEHDWSSLFWFVAQDLIHPPLFYLVLKFWIAVGGESVHWLRLLPIAFSVLAIFPFVRLCRELKLSKAVTLLALFLLAVNGSLIKYTQTLRMYSMMMFLAVLSLWLFARFFNRGKSFVPLLIVNVLLVYTHYFGWLLVGTELLVLMTFQRIKWRRAVVMTGILLASYIPWLLAVWQAARNGSDLAQNIAWQARPGLRELLTFAIDLVEPFYFQASSDQPASMYLISIPLLLVFLTALILYAIEWGREETKRSVHLLLFFALVPFVVTFLASWLLPHSLWGTRHLIIIVPPAAIILANAIFNFPVRVVRVVAICIVIALSGVAFYVEMRREPPQYVWCAWNEVAADIASSEEQPTTVYAFENLVAYHLWFALRDSDRVRVAVVKGVDVRTDDETYFLPRGFDGVTRTELGDVKDKRVWLAFRSFSPDDAGKIRQAFDAVGYQDCITEPLEGVRYGSNTVFKVLMARKPECP